MLIIGGLSGLTWEFMDLMCGLKESDLANSEVAEA